MTTATDTQNHPAVKALAAHQARLGISGKHFARKYLRCSDATWSQLKSGKYPADPTEWLEKSEAALRLLEDEAADAPSGIGLIELAAQRRALKLVRACYTEERNRLVGYLADTGGGKTRLADLLEDVLGDTVVTVEATETWRDNYLSALTAIAAALHLGDDFKSKRAAEAAILGHLKKSPRILVIDEAHSCGTGALNLLKHILNIPDVANRVVMLSMPQLWVRMAKRNPEDWRQLSNRIFGLIKVEEITAEDCRAYLAAKVPAFADLEKTAASAVVAEVRTAANRFGLFNKLQAICDELQKEPGAILDDAAARLAISRVEALRG